MQYDIEYHDRGLAHDLAVISRRRALGWFTTAGAGALLVGCGGKGSDNVQTATTSTTAATTTTTPTTTTGTTTNTTTTSTASSGACVADPAETAGPYPGDGSNTARGLTSNVLTQSGIVRSDIRPSFLGGSTAVAAGIKVTITLTVVNVNASCGQLAGYAVYLWHCDRDGNYSLYDVPNESYLRGVLVTDSNGQVTFTTIFPACYAGRYPHMHFEIFSSLSNATAGRYAVLTSQLAMPADICRTIYGTSGYTSSLSRFSSVSISGDNVFGDNTSAQIAAMTPAFTGDATNGYVAAATIGVRT